MKKGWWRCKVCGYIYKPEIGDSVAKVIPNTPFEDLPSDWICPVCFAGKEAFYPFYPENNS
jgi:rubredoxin